MRPVPHEAYYLNAGYFFYFGHYYCGLAIGLLPPAERDERTAARYAYASDALYTAVGYEREPADKALRDGLQSRLDAGLDPETLRRIQVDAMLQAKGILSEAIGAAR